MQSTQRIDYYKDGLGTRAVLNSDNLEEKKINGESSEDLVKI